MTRRRRADHYASNRVVQVRCCRCRRVLGRLGEGWFQPKRPLAAITSPLPPVFKFLGSPDPLLHGRPMKGVSVIPLDGWTLAGVRCGCVKRDGKQMSWTLNLHRMSHASGFDGRTHDLIAGTPDYGLVGIHDKLEYAVALDVAPDSISDAKRKARLPSEADGDDLMRRIRNRARRKTWPPVNVSRATPPVLQWLAHQDTDDPVDRA